MSAFATLSAIPSSITSGEGDVWAEHLPDYTSGTYSVAYNFSGQTPVDGFQKFSIAGSGSGTTWTFTMPSGVNSPSPGAYAWQQVVTRTSDSAKRQINSGALVVAPNLADMPTESAAAAMLAALEAAIQTLSAGTNQSVSFNGQSFTKKELRTLLEQRTQLQAEVIKEQEKLAALSGNPRSRNVSTRFI